MNRTLALALCSAVALSLPVTSSAQWSGNGVAASTAIGDQYTPTAISDGAGGIFVAWADSRNADLDIYAQHVNANGVVQWTSNGIVIRSAPKTQSDPRIISDGAGGAIIAWVEQRNNNTLDIYAQRIDSAGLIQWTSTGVVVTSASNDQYNPNMTADGLGGAVITWEDARGGNPSDADVYTQRLSSAGAPLWTADGVAISTAANAQTYPTITTDGSGGAIIAWADSRNGIDLGVYAQRIDATGAVQWTAGGAAISATTGDQNSPSLTADGAGGAFINWTDSRSGAIDIYGQRVNSTGVVQWTANGVPICTAAYGQYDPRVIADGSGGFFVTWIDERNTGTSDSDVFVQRVNSSGAAQWITDGVALNTASGSSVQARIILDGAGGAVVAWADTRGGGLNYDIYAQRVNAAGVVQWTADGAALCTATNGQLAPAIVPDGFGGAVVAWQDLRSNTTNDIYANRVSPGGAIPTGAGRTPAAAAALIAGNGYPNPFSSGTAIDVNLREDAHVSMEVFDAAGHRVRVIDVGRIAAGAARLDFDGRDARARVLPSGVYFCRIHAGNDTVTRKLVIQR
ncbi:MAG TPA: T9SS type A sorting domain-containing protein [Candidatus Krumholzibacteria bacterium]|nr:T9SS type A sorting domain-containing protein [Candidatus Krumholzibacteria bacterium]